MGDWPLSTQSGRSVSAGPTREIRYRLPRTHLGALMSLSDLASIGSFVSGVAVLVSLVFLYFQMRQVTEQVRQAEKNQRAVIQQARTTRSADFNIAIAASPELTEASLKVY